MKIPVTVLVQTKNEEESLPECLASLWQFDEVKVVDSNSVDRTVVIAGSFNVEVVNFSWNGEYPKKKQWQLENVGTRNAWILFLDADERMLPELAAEIYELVQRGKFFAAEISLEYHFLGKKLRHGHKVIKRCLLKRDSSYFEDVDDSDMAGMGELEGHYQPRVHGEIARLRSQLVHNDRDPISSWFVRHNRYSDWEAELEQRRELRAQVASMRTSKGRIFQRLPFKPLVFFFYSYILRLGFADGRAGFDYALALSFYYWQIAVKGRELERLRREKG